MNHDSDNITFTRLFPIPNAAQDDEPRAVDAATTAASQNYDNREWVSLSSAERQLGISKSSIHHWAKAGLLEPRYMYVGDEGMLWLARVSRRDLLRTLERRQNTGSAYIPDCVDIAAMLEAQKDRLRFKDALGIDRVYEDFEIAALSMQEVTPEYLAYNKRARAVVRVRIPFMMGEREQVDLYCVSLYENPMRNRELLITYFGDIADIFEVSNARPERALGQIEREICERFGVTPPDLESGLIAFDLRRKPDELADGVARLCECIQNLAVLWQAPWFGNDATAALAATVR